MAFMKGQDIHHQAMLYVSHRRTAMAMKMVSDGGTFLSLSPPLSFDQNVAKGPWYGPFKLTPSYYFNLIGVISLFISYWPPPPTMDAVTATIVAGRRA